MEYNSKCYLCDSKNWKIYIFTCFHSICIQCINKLLLTDYLSELQHKDHIQIKCNCNTNGILDLSLTMIENILVQLSCNSCLKHNLYFSSFCQQCDEWFCPQCIDNHSSTFKDHIIEDPRCKNREMCHKHPDVTMEFICKDCGIEICSSCLLKGEKHFKHKAISAGVYLNEQKQKLKEILPYEVLIKNLEKIDTKFKDKFQQFYDSTLTRFEDAIKDLDEIKNQFKSEMNKLLDRQNLVMGIMKVFYSNLYSVLWGGVPTVGNIHSLKTLNFELPEILYNNNDHIAIEMALLIEVVDQMKKITKYAEIDYLFPKLSSGEFECIHTLDEHTNSVIALLELQEGFLVSGSADNSIRLWECDNLFNCASVNNSHKNYVTALIHLSDGRLVSGSGDKSINIWEVSNKSLTLLHTITGHEDWVISLVELSEGLIGSGSSDNTIRIWDMNNNFKCIYVLNQHNNYVTCLIQIHEGIMASGSGDYNIRIWDTKKAFACIQILEGHLDWVRSLSKLKDGRIASGSNDNTIKIWTESENNFICSQTLSDHSDFVYSVLQLRDGRLASGSGDSTIKIWTEKNNIFSCTQTLKGHTYGIASLIELKDDQLASGSSDFTIKIWKEKKK